MDRWAVGRKQDWKVAWGGIPKEMMGREGWGPNVNHPYMEAGPWVHLICSIQLKDMNCRQRASSNSGTAAERYIDSVQVEAETCILWLHNLSSKCTGWHNLHSPCFGLWAPENAWTNPDSGIQHQWKHLSSSWWSLEHLKCHDLQDNWILLDDPEALINPGTNFMTASIPSPVNSNSPQAPQPRFLKPCIHIAII